MISPPSDSFVDLNLFNVFLTFLPVQKLYFTEVQSDCKCSIKGRVKAWCELNFSSTGIPTSGGRYTDTL